MSEAKPFPKAAQLARGERRYRRKVASPKQWQAIIAAKRGPCRVCRNTRTYRMEYHHLVSRAQLGDDVADNIVSLCAFCHSDVTQRRQPASSDLAARLSDAEYAYIIDKLGEGGMERLFVVGR